MQTIEIKSTNLISAYAIMRIMRKAYGREFFIRQEGVSRLYWIISI